MPKIRKKLKLKKKISEKSIIPVFYSSCECNKTNYLLSYTSSENQNYLQVYFCWNLAKFSVSDRQTDRKQRSKELKTLL